MWAWTTWIRPLYYPARRSHSSHISPIRIQTVSSLGVSFDCLPGGHPHPYFVPSRVRPTHLLQSSGSYRFLRLLILRTQISSSSRLSQKDIQRSRPSRSYSLGHTGTATQACTLPMDSLTEISLTGNWNRSMLRLPTSSFHQMVALGTGPTFMHSI